MKFLGTDEASLEEAAALIKKGKIVAFPTETVYGLGASMHSEDAIKQIYAVKGRAFTKPLAAHVYSLKQVEMIAEVNPSFYDLAKRFLPGPLSIILKKKSFISNIACQETIAIRMPDHKTALSLIEKVGHPLFATSANRSQNPSHKEAKSIYHEFDGKIAAVIDAGFSPLGVESTIISLVDPKQPKILRIGPIPSSILLELLNES